MERSYVVTWTYTNGDHYVQVVTMTEEQADALEEKLERLVDQDEIGDFRVCTDTEPISYESFEQEARGALGRVWFKEEAE